MRTLKQISGYLIIEDMHKRMTLFEAIRKLERAGSGEVHNPRIYPPGGTIDSNSGLDTKSKLG